jgi:hypothetical protein
MAGAATSQQVLVAAGGLPPPVNYALTYATSAADPYWTWSGANVARRFGGSITTTSSTGNLFAGGAVGATGYAMSFVDGAFNLNSGSTKTFTDFPIGTEHPDRYVLCGCVFYTGGGTQSGSPSATIGGNPASIVASSYNLGNQQTAFVFFALPVAAGTTATIAVTWGAASNRAMLATWRLLSSSTPSYTQDFKSGTGQTLNVSGNFAAAVTGIRRTADRYTASSADAIP